MSYPQLHIVDSVINQVGRDQYNITPSKNPHHARQTLNHIITQLESVFDILEKYTIHNAAYNSYERQSEQASTCAEGTRKDILTDLCQWARSSDRFRICWLQGHAGTGKSAIAHTIAQQCDKGKLLAFSYFFSRRNPDRSEITKFFPTFAYQLCGFLPSIQQPITDALGKNPAIFHQSLKDQFTKLIVDPVLSILGPVPSMICVIDGLDEYTEDTGQVPLAELIGTLFDDIPDQFPFRFLLTSRPEARIVEIFRDPVINSRTSRLFLQDSERDVRTFLSSKLREIQMKLNLPISWPSMAELETLIFQSHGLFIYADTLIRFIGSEYGLPRERLRVAIAAHRGIDPLYDQVLSEAEKYDGFERAIGAVVLLGANPLHIDKLGQLLGLDVRLALRGCSSILWIPDRDNDTVRPYHTSLKDFLQDPDRSGKHFLDPTKHNLLITNSYISYMASYSMSNSRDEYILDCACRHWARHFSLGLANNNGMDYITPEFAHSLEGLMKKLSSQWLKDWMHRLNDHRSVETIRQELRSAFKSIMVSRQSTSIKLK